MSWIMIADDDLDFRGMLKMLLERHGHQVMEACDGFEATRICRDRIPDLAVVDIIMPNKEGLELITDLRRNSPEVPVMAVSGGGRIGPDTYLELARKMGADRILTKPFPLDEFMTAVDELLGRA
jgi:DNA-binding response OmpR family regulator